MAFLGLGKKEQILSARLDNNGVAVKEAPIDVGYEAGSLFAAQDHTTKGKEKKDMSKSNSAKLEAAKKWLEKHGQNNSNAKVAEAALLAAEKSVAETAALRAKLAEAVANKKEALLALDKVMQKAQTERKLKQKEAKLQAKLASVAHQG